VSESAEQRSRTMRAVKSRDTNPELTIRRLLHSKGYRYRLHRADLPGSPDIVFPSRRKVIFVHGCFWHSHSCPRGARIPTNNREYWKQKIARNMARDAKVLATLEENGWRSLVVWECELRKPADSVERAIRAFLDGCTK
jgi:DNA mismatch endonuclease, patch repair protein